MNTPKRLRQEHKQEEVFEHQHETRGLEFETVEEMLRHDRAQSELPPAIATRLGTSLANEKPRPWWKRLFKW